MYNISCAIYVNIASRKTKNKYNTEIQIRDMQ